MSVWNHNLWDYFNFIEVRLLWTACVPFLANFLDYVKYTVLNRVYIVNATVTHQVPPLFSSRVPLYLYLCIVKRKEKSNEIVPFCSLVNKLQYNQGLEHKKTFLIMLKCKMFWFSIFVPSSIDVVQSYLFICLEFRYVRLNYDYFHISSLNNNNDSKWCWNNMKGGFLR